MQDREGVAQQVMSGANASPIGRGPTSNERSECKPDRAQPTSNERSECKPDRAQPTSNVKTPFIMKRIFWVLPLLAAIPLLAVTPQFWEIRTYDEFRKGKLTNLSLTSDDELILAPRFDMVFNTEQTLIWSAVADSKGNVYLGTGHDGKIYKVDPSGKGAMLLLVPELGLLALAVDSKDALYAGTSPDGKVYKIEGGAPKEFF